MSERKVPRVDWAKYRGGRAAGRREAETVLGDSLRELGCVRVQGHAGTAAPLDHPVDPAEVLDQEASLRQLATGVLEALAEYFGLPARSFTDFAADGLAPLAPDAAPVAGGPGPELAPVPGLLLLLTEVPGGLAVCQQGGEWREAAAHPGELLVVAGEALGRLTADRVRAAGVRWPASGAGGWLLPARAGASVAALPAFAG